jgi:hypothetical protein
VGQGGDWRASGGGGTCAPPQQLARVQVIPPRRHCRPHPHTMQRSAERWAASRGKQCGPCALTAAIGLLCALDEMCRGCRIQLSVRGVPRLLFAHSIAVMRLLRPTGCSNQRPNRQTVNGCQGTPKAATTFTGLVALSSKKPAGHLTRCTAAQRRPLPRDSVSTSLALIPGRL